MPLIGSAGAASAKGFGFGNSASLAGVPFLAVVTSPLNSYINASATDSKNNLVLYSSINRLLMKVSTTGIVLWAKTFASIQFYSLVVDGNDNIYLAGYDSNNGTISGSSLTKTDSTGNVLWSSLGDPGNATYYKRAMIWQSVKLLPNGNIAVAGNYIDNIQIYTCCGPQKYDVPYGAVAVFNSSGVFQWGRKFGTNSQQLPSSEFRFSSIGVDASSNIYLSGMGPQVSSNGNQAVPIIKYNSSGTYQWGYRYKNPDSTVSWGGTLAVTSSGDVFAASTSEYKSYAFKTNSSGTTQWGLNFTGTSSRDFYFANSGIVLDETGAAYFSGRAYDPNTTDVQDAGFMKINSSGSLQYVRALGRTGGSSSNSEYASSIAISGDNFLTLGTYFSVNNSVQLFARLKSDGSQTGTYTVASNSYRYISFPITAFGAAPTVTNATSAFPTNCEDTALTFTVSSRSISTSNATPSVSVTPL